jgi:hypothetical protein
MPIIRVQNDMTSGEQCHFAVYFTNKNDIKVKLQCPDVEDFDWKKIQLEATANGQPLKCSQTGFAHKKKKDKRTKPQQVTFTLEGVTPTDDMTFVVKVKPVDGANIGDIKCDCKVNGIANADTFTFKYPTQFYCTVKKEIPKPQPVTDAPKTSKIPYRNAAEYLAKHLPKENLQKLQEKCCKDGESVQVKEFLLRVEKYLK